MSLEIDEYEIKRQINQIVFKEMPEAINNQEWGDLKQIAQHIIEDVETLRDKFNIDISSSFDKWKATQ